MESEQTLFLSQICFWNNWFCATIDIHEDTIYVAYIPSLYIRLQLLSISFSKGRRLYREFYKSLLCISKCLDTLTKSGNQSKIQENQQVQQENMKVTYGRPKK